MDRPLLALGLLLLVQGSGCFFLPFDPDEEMVYGSPCLDVNILDGLDETDSAEIQDLFDCLNQSGTFDPLVPVVDEIVAGSDRNLEPLAYHAAAIVNTAPDLIPIWETLGATQQLLIEENEFLLDALHLVAEFVYGVPWPDVEELAAAGDLQNAELLADGPLGHLVPVLRVWAEVILDADDVEDSGEILDHMLSMPELRDTLVTLRELNRDNETNHLFDDFSEYWGEFFVQTHDDVTGRNTLVDAMDALVSPVPQYDGQPLAIQTMLPYAEPMFADEVVRQRLVEGIGDLYDHGTLDDLPDQLFWLMTVDMHGGSLDPGEESAFESAMVLLDEADAEFVCDPLGLELVYIDSVSVWLLQEIVNYGIDAHTIEELVSFVEGMYDTVIDWVAFACDVPPILLTHFDAIIRLAESGALHTLIPLLNSLADPDVADHNYLRELVDIVHLLVALDLIAPIEGLLAPTLGQHFMPAVLAGIGAFVDPSYDLAGGDVYTLLDVVIYLITPPEGDDLYERAPLIIAGRIVDGIIAGEPDELDAFIVTWGELLAHPDAVTHDIQYGIEGLLDLDPDLKSLDYVGDILDHEEVCTHWLLFFENQGLMDALGMPGSAGGQEVPLAALGRLIADGTTEDLILLLAWLTDLLAVLGIDL
jgi:hypothetical protein